MAEILKGAPVVKALCEKMTHDVEALKAQGVSPTIAILRVGDRHDDVQYENSAIKRCNSVGVRVMTLTLPGDATQDEFDRALSMLNNDPGVHGILMFMPLPEQLDAERARMLLSPEKDIDGITDRSLSGVFTSTDKGFPSCTAQATMEMLHYYGIDIEGKKAASYDADARECYCDQLPYPYRGHSCHNKQIRYPGCSCRTAETCRPGAHQSGSGHHRRRYQLGP